MVSIWITFDGRLMQINCLPRSYYENNSSELFFKVAKKCMMNNRWIPFPFTPVDPKVNLNVVGNESSSLSKIIIDQSIITFGLDRLSSREFTS